MTMVALFPNTQRVKDQTLKTWGSRLSSEDKSRAATLRGDQRLREFVIARTLLSGLAEEKLGTTVRILSAPHQPPRLKTPAGEIIACSISHSRDAVLVGINTEGDIGVDIESHREKSVDRIVARYFWADGQAQFSQQSPGTEKAWFYREWCAREALLKFGGEGNLFGLLAAPLKLPPGTSIQVRQNADLTLAAVQAGSGGLDFLTAQPGDGLELELTPCGDELPDVHGAETQAPGPV